MRTGSKGEMQPLDIEPWESRFLARQRQTPRSLPTDYMPKLVDMGDKVSAQDVACDGRLLKLAAAKPLTEQRRLQLRWSLWMAKEQIRLKLGQPISSDPLAGQTRS